MGGARLEVEQKLEVSAILILDLTVVHIFSVQRCSFRLPTSSASRQQARFITRARVQVCCLETARTPRASPANVSGERVGSSPPLPSLPSRRAHNNPGQWAPHRRTRGPMARTRRGPLAQIPEHGLLGHPKVLPEAAPRGPPCPHYMTTMGRTFNHCLQTSGQGSAVANSESPSVTRCTLRLPHHVPVSVFPMCTLPGLTSAQLTNLTGPTPPTCMTRP